MRIRETVASEPGRNYFFRNTTYKFEISFTSRGALDPGYFSVVSLDSAENTMSASNYATERDAREKIQKSRLSESEKERAVRFVNAARSAI